MDTHARELISQNRLSAAIKQMHAQVKKGKIKNALSLIESRLNDVNEKMRLGLLSEENANLELNKIRNSLLELCDQMDAAEQVVGVGGQSFVRLGLIGAGVLLLLVASWFAFLKPASCDDRKVAVLVADFQSTEKVEETDGFANTLVTRMDFLLPDDVYDVSPVGPQSRQVKRYDEFIQQEHFLNTCDTSGMFVNGFLSLEQEVFNIYITLANLKMNVPDLAQDNSIVLDNPAGLEFSISNNANFLADFLIGIIQCFEGKPYDALQRFFELEKGDETGITREDKKFQAALAHFKGNCYAMRGDNERAKEQYEIVKKNGSAEMQTVAEKNSATSDRINQKMQDDPELRSKLSENRSQHSKFEDELNRILKQIFNPGIDKVGRFLKSIK